MTYSVSNDIVTVDESSKSQKSFLKTTFEVDTSEGSSVASNSDSTQNRETLMNRDETIKSILQANSKFTEEQLKAMDDSTLENIHSLIGNTDSKETEKSAT